jgi:hypothetical protein
MKRNSWWLGFDLCGLKFGDNRPLYIGLLVPRHRAHGVLPILSLIGLDLAIFGKKLKRGES